MGSNSKVCIFSDIHFGEGRNSQMKLDVACKNIDFIIDTCQQENISEVIFCGDWFHSRDFISVNTFYQSYNALTKLTQYIDKIWLIVGNHDSYLKNTIDIHSLKAFEQIPNVEIVDKPKVIKLNGKKTLLAPWGIEIQQYQNQDIKYAFGHFDPNGAQQYGAVSFGCDYGMDELTKISPLVFSGHYHISKEYKTKYGKVIMVGSPSQQTWGDCEMQRGLYILDTYSDKTTFVENNKAPKHINILYSEIVKTKKLPSKSLLAGNYVKLIVDCPYQYLQVHNVCNKMLKVNPLLLEPEYYYSDQVMLNTQLDLSKNIKNHTDYIREYVKNPEIEFPKEINRDKLLKMALSIFSTVSSSNE